MREQIAPGRFSSPKNGLGPGLDLVAAQHAFVSAARGWCALARKQPATASQKLQTVSGWRRCGLSSPCCYQERQPGTHAWAPFQLTR